MNISAPFIARPVGTALVTLGIALAGAIAFFLLPIAPATGRVSDDLGIGFATRRQSGDYGGDRRHTAGACTGQHCRGE